MAPNAAQSLWYVYGIVPAQDTPASPPLGLDDATVSVERGEDANVAALVSVLTGPEYAPDALEAKSGEVDWLSPRAVAHDRVLTWASDRGAVVPLPMFSVFSGRDAVRGMLRDRGAQLSATLARVSSGREYALRVYRVDAELMGVVADLSPRLGALAATAAAASPGQRYLLERKLDAEKKSEIRGVTHQIVDDIVGRLTSHARQVVRSPIPRVSDAGETRETRGTMVLNAAFLVAPDQLEAFQRTLTALVTERGAQGFRFDFTGPWPPYHFVGESSDG
jgi:hypothetical protein